MKLTGITLSRVQYLARHRVVSPTRIKTGSGKEGREIDLYTAEDLANFELIAKVDKLLSSYGLRRAIELGKLADIVDLIGETQQKAPNKGGRVSTQ